MFEQYIEASEANRKKEERIKIDFSDNALINPNAFKNIIENIDKYSDEELYDVVKRNYMFIFTEDTFRHDNNNIYRITNNRFLVAAIHVFSRATDITMDNIIICNKLAYDYLNTNNKSDSTINLFLNLAKVVNRDLNNRLLNIGIPEDIAVQMLISYRSSFNTATCISRLNNYIQTLPADLMTIQTCVNVYEVLFDSIELLFIQLMLTEALPNLESLETYDNMGTAILYMIDNMPFVSLRKLLINYAASYNSGYMKKQYKFKDQILQHQYSRYHLSQLDNRFPRIVSAIEQIRELDNIVID